MRIRISCHYFLGFSFGILLLCLQVAPAQQARAPISGDSGRGKWKHPKHMDDLDAIGSRNVGGNRYGNWYSLEREVKLGKEYAYEVDGFTTTLRDPFITEYVNRIGQNLVCNSDAKVPFVIKVIDSDEANAFALPGGFLYVNRGLLLVTEDEAELAAVMAHEIAHVAARHATRQLTHSHIFDLASLPLIAFGGGIIVAARETVGSIASMKVSRNYEAEADYLAVEYAYKAGYDPTALITILERLGQEGNQSSGPIANAFATHPKTRDRIWKMQQEIARILPVRPVYIVSTSDFDEMRARLLAKETNHSKRAYDAHRPTLRHREQSGTEAQTPAADGRPIDAQ